MSKRLFIAFVFLLILIQHSNTLFFNKAIVFDMFAHHYSKPNEVAWFVTNLAWRFTCLFAISGWFFSIKWNETLEKTVLLFFLIDAIKELIELIVWNNQYDNNWGLYWNMLFITGIFFAINKSYYKNIELIPESLMADDGVYIVPSYPKNIITFIGSICGYGVGSIDYYVKYNDIIHVYCFNKTGSLLHTQINNDVKNRYLKIPEANPELFITTDKPAKWKFITNNCVTMFRKELKINLWKLDFVPSIFVSRLMNPKKVSK